MPLIVTVKHDCWMSSDRLQWYWETTKKKRLTKWSCSDYFHFPCPPMFFTSYPFGIQRCHTHSYCGDETYLWYGDATLPGQLLLCLLGWVRVTEVWVEVFVQDFWRLLAEITPLSPEGTQKKALYERAGLTHDTISITKTPLQRKLPLNWKKKLPIHPHSHYLSNWGSSNGVPTRLRDWRSGLENPVLATDTTLL